METKYHIKYPEEGDHIIECQQEELKRFFEKNKLWELKQDLNEMTRDILSYEHTEKDYSKLIKRLKFLVNYGWDLVFQDHRYQIRFEQESVTYAKNPFYLKKSAQSAEFRQRNSGLSGFYGDITSLTLKEASDIYAMLNKFYNEISVVSWLKLLDDWLYASEQVGGLWEFVQSDENPIKTQRFLLNLMESLYLFSRPDFLSSVVEYPTIYLFNSRTSYKDMDLDIDAVDQYNPYFWLEHVFSSKSLDDYIADLNYLYKSREEDSNDSSSNRDIFQMGREIRILIETVWINIQCNILPYDFTRAIDGEVMEKDEINRRIAELLKAISPDRPVELQDLIGSIFEREWKVRSYRQIIDDLVEHRICNRLAGWYYIHCKIEEMELLVQICYLMLLEIRKQKIEGKLRWSQL
ncbi:hypothetical protein [Sphingobacterium thalpophilum]|uniref:hypothetical protein n=1 Tax=Sphingobacterium thalpophilum TaxID=259 RepID=UPI0024A7864E|nr:hypothetical protein [Sphingobacterium thalpophilum]